LINKSGYAEKIIWNICGDGPEKDKILSLKTWQNVHYLGYVESKYMPEIYKQSSLFISTSHWEGFPYNLLEAQGASLPVLAYNISGCNDIIDDQINGILVENVSQFKNEVVNFVDGKYQFCDIREYISKKFNQALIYEQLLDLISSVAKKSVKNII
jgi:glycosyltransferase involved in cell wall biosynthesis